MRVAVRGFAGNLDIFVDAYARVVSV